MPTPMYTSDKMTLADLLHESSPLIWTMLIRFVADPWRLTYAWQELFEDFFLGPVPTMLSQMSSIHLACHVEHTAIHC